MIRSILLLGSMLSTSPANADESVAVEALRLSDRGEEIQLIAAGIRPKNGVVDVDGDRIEIEISGRPQAPLSLGSKDETIKRVDLYGGDRPRVSLKTRFGPRTTRKLANQALLEETAGGFILHIPRDADQPLTRAPAAPVQPALVETPVAAPVPPPAPTVSETPRLSTIALPSTTAESYDEDMPRELRDALASEPAPFNAARSWMIGGIGIAACLALIHLARKKRSLIPSSDEIRVLSTKSLGGKTRLALVSIQQRTLLLSIGEKGAELIAEIDSPRTSTPPISETPPALTSGPLVPRATRRPPPPIPAPTFAGFESVERERTSPAIRGLLALKQQVDGVAADKPWAQSFFAELQEEARR